MDPASQRKEATAPRALPTGTVTFLFTDIEGSTERWESHRDAMKAAVDKHDSLMRTAIESHQGYVFKTLGDAFCAAFRTAPEAVNAALDAQGALLQEDFSAVNDLRVRMALHSGYAHEREGDYFGPTVNRVARLLAIGHGGQILVSTATSDLAEGELPPQTSLRDLGSHRLKDLAHPEHVFSLVAPGLPTEFAPLKSLDAIPNNLPLQVTTFIGRENELEEVKRLLENSRLLTLSGPGGVGKTRLALQAAADQLDHYPDGVWLVEFATLTDPDLVPSEVALVLNVRVASDHSLTESIMLALDRKRALLIFDNCEHVVIAVAKLARSIVQSCSHIKIITTSREALGIGGEQILRVSSLAVPEKSEVLNAEAAAAYSALALFTDRATMANKSFRITSENVGVVTDICRRLDGIPFAIELAAARLRVLSVSDLSRALNERFRVLTGGDRTALPRQKTMRALIDWSYDLLSEKEKRMLRRLAVFAGGWTLEAASTVCAGDDIEPFDVIDIISQLVDKSLVVAETGGETARYRLLDSTREYALEKLSESGERETLERRHAEFFRKLGQEWGELYFMEAPATWLADVRLELDNFRAAIEWGLAGHDVLLAGSLAGALGDFWYDAGLFGAGRRWVEAALKALNGGLADSEDRRTQAVGASLYLALANISTAKVAHETALKALQLYTKLCARRGVAFSQYIAGFSLYEAGQVSDAQKQVAEARSAFEALHIDRWVARCLNLEAIIQWLNGDLDGARALYDRALGINSRIGDERGIALVSSNLAEVEFAAGNIIEAIRLANKALEVNRRLGRIHHITNTLTNIALYEIRMDEWEIGRQLAREALSMSRECQDADTTAWCIQHLALVTATRGDLTRAARLLGYVNETIRASGFKRQNTEAWGFEKLMPVLRSGLSGTEIDKLMSEGSGWSETTAAEEALKI